MTRIRLAAAITLAALAAAACGSQPAGARETVTAPAAAVFTGLALRDPTVMQSFAYDGTHKVWVFAQVSSARPPGDLTLTRVSASGARLGWMHLTGFGHGLSIGIDGSGGIWTEAHAVAEPARGWALPGSYGNQVARFGWHSGATITPAGAGVERFGVNAGAPEQAPSVDAADGLIAVQYWSAGLRAFRWAVYNLAAFRAHRYTALARFTVPAALAGSTEQGWVLASRTQVANWQGTATGSPGNATLAMVSTAGTLLSRVRVTVPGEPEGMTRAALGNLCTGFASGPAGARRANVYCQAKP